MSLIKYATKVDENFFYAFVCYKITKYLSVVNNILDIDYAIETKV